jgi:histidinol dehydrogenase
VVAVSPDVALLQALTALLSAAPDTGAIARLVHVGDLEATLAVAQDFAPEHLQLVGAGAEALAPRATHAGCLFVGQAGATAFGDYIAGSNHVLPTGGCARHSSGLSVQSFLRGIHLVEYDEQALADVAGHIDALAGAEDLPAHAAAVRARQQS